MTKTNSLIYYNSIITNLNLQYFSGFFKNTVTYKIFEEYKILRNYNNYFFASKRYRYHGFGEIGGGFRFGNNFEFQNLWKVELDFDYKGDVKVSISHTQTHAVAFAILQINS